ncbi:MAG: hypothetical protein L3J39_02890 [Verrucomicrobiales bacterium]|nr:hypothetical protein [Verrucomicrobiales bacterium]
MAWAPSLTRFHPDNKHLWLAWTGTTEDGLPSSVYSYQWINPQPEKAIISVALQSGDHANASVFLLGLSGIKP